MRAETPVNSCDAACGAGVDLVADARGPARARGHRQAVGAEEGDLDEIAALVVAVVLGGAVGGPGDDGAPVGAVGGPADQVAAGVVGPVGSVQAARQVHGGAAVGGEEGGAGEVAQRIVGPDDAVIAEA